MWHTPLIGVFVSTNRSLCGVSVLMCIQRQTQSPHTYIAPLGDPGPPNLCPWELTLFSPSELYLTVGHLATATGDRLLQPGPNPGESIDASMAGGLSFAQAPRGKAAHFNKCKVMLSTSKQERYHKLLYVSTYPHMCSGAHVYADVMEDYLSSGQKHGRVMQWCS